MNNSISTSVSQVARKDITELNQKIEDFQTGNIAEDKFKHFRLTRGVYGQRQLGVQMIRIKLPYGKMTAAQLIRIAEVSDEYATGNLHLTTRQDIQLHYVKLKDSPALWARLEEEGVTLREACGNVVRNVTASAEAGISPAEPFDVTPYAHAFTHYFLRNPICQDMGRKFKVAFSSSEADSAFTYFHDIGFIAKTKEINGEIKRGFKVVVGGGLGAQSFVAQTVYEFLEEDQIIPFSEGVIRVFDRFGEREKRQKARLKFLVQKIGIDELLALVKQESKALKSKSFPIDPYWEPVPLPTSDYVIPAVTIKDQDQYDRWLKTNVVDQKQAGFYAISLRVPLGDISFSNAQKLAHLVKDFGGDDIRITVNQGLLLKFFQEDSLPFVYTQLQKLGLAKPGFDSIHDITACPGTDTCNLGVANSTGLAKSLENVLAEEFEDLVFESGIKIKISGCMNSCGQHMGANIGFHGSSIKNGALVAPAMVTVLGGGVAPDGEGFVAEKVIKIPSKKAPDLLRNVLNDYGDNAIDGELFNQYFQRMGKMHFYQLLKPLADVNGLLPEDYMDWGQNKNFKPVIGTGECAGITLDVVGTVVNEALEKVELAREGLQEGIYADSIYNSYTAMVIGAKALLLSEDHRCNTQAGIIRDFEEKFVQESKFFLASDFESYVYQMNQNEPNQDFAQSYLEDAQKFIDQVTHYRQLQIEINEKAMDKQVVDHYYKA